jgi:hypothetical protein
MKKNSLRDYLFKDLAICFLYLFIFKKVDEQKTINFSLLTYLYTNQVYDEN